MYGRKVQLIKKKKTGLACTAKSTGSNWGPRIALYEREQQQQQQHQFLDELQSQTYGTNKGTVNLTSNYGEFKNPCAINGGRPNNENNNPSYYPVIGKYLRTGIVNGYAGRNSNNTTKPLKVIIPPPDQFHYESSGKRNQNRDADSLPSTETWRSSDHDGEFQDSNSISMTRTTVVPTDDEEGDENGPEGGAETPLVTAGQYEPLCRCDTPPRIHRDSPESTMNSANGPGKLFKKRMNGCGSSSSSTNKVTQQVFSMVYVPMEASVRRPKLLSPSFHGDLYDGRSLEVPVYTPTSVATPTSTIKDTDNDSLLESFDSVIFKPKWSPSATPPGKAANSKFVGIGLKSRLTPTPPPLPPKNQPTPPTSVSGCKKPIINKSLRFADNLDMITNSNLNLKPNSSPPAHVKRNSPPPPPTLMVISMPTSNLDVINNVKVSSNGKNETQLKDRVSSAKNKHTKNTNKNGGNSGASNAKKLQLQFDDAVEVNGNGNGSGNSCEYDEAFANFAYTSCKSESELLTMSCGHTRDSYSTLSSIQSQPQSQFDDVQQQDVASNSNSKDRTEKSALQQLRDLSILIGGSFHTPEDEQTQLENDLKARKSSDATSADSGKGSANESYSAAEILDNSNSNCSCSESTCIFRPECEECQMFFKNPFEKTPTFCPEEEYEGSKRKISSSSGSASGNSGGTKSEALNLKNSKKALKFTKNYKNGRGTSKSKNMKLMLPQVLQNGDNSGSSNVDDLNMNLKCSCAKGSGGIATTKTQLLLRKSEGFILHKKFKGGSTSKRSPGGNSNSSSGNSIDPNLFTIDEEASLIADSTHANSSVQRSHTQRLHTQSQSQSKSHLHGNLDDSDEGIDVSPESAVRGQQHFHPKCWLAPDATMGWSDLESLYSQNLKREKPITVNGECWTCWREMSQFKYNDPDLSNRTIDRTKRMFIWLNKRPKEFNAPWWEAKKQASIKWLTSKAYAHIPNSAVLQDPFKESKRDKTKYRMRDEIIVGLANGKLYCMALDNLYQKNRQKRAQGLSHWEIIKILSRRGIYVAQPSDMKLTEGTLRQKKPLRIAAHIALIEAIMGLYAKELVTRERILPILTNLGQDLESDVEIPEHLIISWINGAINTIKSYILSNNRSKSFKMTSVQIQRWLRVPTAGEIRDLNDGVGLCCLLALYFSADLSLDEIAIGVGGHEETLSIYEMIVNHTHVQKLCHYIFPEKIYHLCITDFLYIHGYMKQNILSFLIDLFYHLEVNPVTRVNRLPHVPLSVQL